jgi:1,4-alpha-glucan branching enzyme
VQKLVRDLNRLYEPEAALWEVDGEPAGFEWIDVNNASENIIAFLRRSQTGRELICVCNFSAVPKRGYRVESLGSNDYDLIINTDSAIYGGNESVSINGPELDLPPLTTLWFAPRKSPKKTKPQKGTKSTKKKRATKSSNK